MNTYSFNRIWAAIKRVGLGAVVQRESDLPLAWDIHQATIHKPSMRDLLAQALLANPFPVLRGAEGPLGESLRYLHPASDAAIATTGTNGVNFNVYDWTLVKTIGFVWTVAGTVTAMVMDFDLHSQLAGASLLTDKLDGTNGVITAPSLASQAIGNLLYKDLDATGPVLIQPGYSIRANVTTTTTAGNGIPFVLGYPKPDSMANLTRAFKSA